MNHLLSSIIHPVFVIFQSIHFPERKNELLTRVKFSATQVDILKHNLTQNNSIVCYLTQTANEASFLFYCVYPFHPDFVIFGLSQLPDPKRNHYQGPDKDQ